MNVKLLTWAYQLLLLQEGKLESFLFANLDGHVVLAESYSPDIKGAESQNVQHPFLNWYTWIC